MIPSSNFTKEKFTPNTYSTFQDMANYCAWSAEGEISFGDLIHDCFRSVLGIYKYHLHRELTSNFKRLDKEAIVEIMLSIPPEKKQEFLSAYNDSKWNFEDNPEVSWILQFYTNIFVLVSFQEHSCTRR